MRFEVVLLVPDPRADNPKVESGSCQGAGPVTMWCKLRRGQVPQGAMGPVLIVVDPPGFNHCLSQ